MMRKKIKNLMLQAIKNAHSKGDLLSTECPNWDVETPRMESYGDFSTNIAMIMASIQKMPPRKIAEILVKHVDDDDEIISKINIDGPGFINFFINISSWHQILRLIHEQDTQYGASNIGNGKKVQIEFVSSNPTGPLHVGHGRCAVVGDSLANILLRCGYDVEKEYYVNDSGRQINTLGRSVFLRLKQLDGQNVQFPEDCYQGEYIHDIAEIIKQNNEAFPQNEEQAISYCSHFAVDNILTEIKEDLEAFGIKFDNWQSEQSLYDSGKVKSVINDFRKQNIIYEKDGAFWFKTSDFGDEKDRVVIRENGQTTYFASDIAYHQDKFERGFEQIINVWGADHHGYIPRVAAAIEAAGYDKNQFNVILVQLVNLMRAKQPVAMSTRAGEFVTLKEVIKEVGSDAARFIFLMRHHESPLDFDLELAKKKTNDNPVFYVQYVHARISSIIRKATEMKIHDIIWNEKSIAMLKEPEEIYLIKTLSNYPETVKNSVKFMEPHRITFYLMNLASCFHAYYNKHRVLTDNIALTQGRLYLILAVKKIIRNGLALLGVSAPEEM